MKWPIFLLLALIVTFFGIMFTEGAFKHVCQIAFFGALVLGFLTLTVDFSRT